MYLLDIEPLDLGSDVRAVGLELTEADENREPVREATPRAFGAESFLRPRRKKTGRLIFSAISIVFAIFASVIRLPIATGANARS